MNRRGFFKILGAILGTPALKIIPPADTTTLTITETFITNWENNFDNSNEIIEVIAYQEMIAYDPATCKVTIQLNGEPTIVEERFLRAIK